LVEETFRSKLATLQISTEEASIPTPLEAKPVDHTGAGKVHDSALQESAPLNIDKSVLSIPEPRRLRDREHLKYLCKKPCVVCGRQPSDAHHLRFVQRRAFGRKVSDEFTVPLCRGHHREVHRYGDEESWWSKSGLDPIAIASALWTQTHPIGMPTSMPS